ncbi:MAG: hypothetical protein ACYTF1_05500 [Planctomycetota bacterium]
MPRKLLRILYGRPTRSKKYTFIGAGTGLAIGLLQAFLSALTSTDLLKQAMTYFFQIEVGYPFLGGAIGYIIAKRIERRKQRRANNLCINCSYNLTGNTSGICPECGEII